MLWAEAANREEFSRSKWVFLMSLYSSSFSHWVKRKIISCRCCVYWTSQSTLTNQMMVFWHSDAFFKHMPNKDERRLVHILKNHHLKRQCVDKGVQYKTWIVSTTFPPAPSDIFFFILPSLPIFCVLFSCLVLNHIPLASPSLSFAAVTFPALLNTTDHQLADQHLRPIGKEQLAYMCSACFSFKPWYATFRPPFGKGP